MVILKFQRVRNKTINEARVMIHIASGLVGSLEIILQQLVNFATRFASESLRSKCEGISENAWRSCEQDLLRG